MARTDSARVRALTDAIARCHFVAITKQRDGHFVTTAYSLRDYRRDFRTEGETALRAIEAAAHRLGIVERDQTG